MTLVVDRRVRLRAVDAGDLPRLYRLEHDTLLGDSWRFDTTASMPRDSTDCPEDFDEYVERFNAGLLLAVAIESTTADPELVGLAYAFNPNMRMASVELGFVAVPSADGAQSARSSLLACAGFAFFMNHLFEEYPLQRLLAWVRASNLERFSSVVGPVFERHATLDRHLGEADGDSDPAASSAMHLLGLSAETWNTLHRPRVLARLRASGVADGERRV